MTDTTIDAAGDPPAGAVSGRAAKALRVLRSPAPEHRAARQSLGIFALRGASAGIAYLSQVLLARWMGDTQYGVFVSVWSWLLIIAMVSSLGLSITVQRFIHAARAGGDQALERGILWGTSAIAVVIATGLMVVGVCALWLLQDSVGPAYLGPAVLVLVCLPMFALTDVQDGIARSYDWMGLAMVPPYVLRPLVLAACIGLVVAFHPPATAVTAAGAAVIATWVTCLVQLVLLRRRLGRIVPRGPRTLRLRHWVVVSLPVLLSDGFSFLLLNADVLVLTLLRPPEEVAVYFAATRTISLIAFIAFAVAAAMGPRFAEAYACGDRDALRAHFARSVSWTLYPSLGAAAVMLALGPFILSLFGESFVAGYVPMCVLAAGFVLRASVGASERLLNMAGAERACALVYCCAITVNIGLNLLLIPAFGLSGAALATVLALMTEASGLALLVRRRLGVSVIAGWHPGAALGRA